jgi:hypothetical protein
MNRSYLLVFFISLSLPTSHAQVAQDQHFKAVVIRETTQDTRATPDFINRCEFLGKQANAKADLLASSNIGLERNQIGAATIPSFQYIPKRSVELCELKIRLTSPDFTIKRVTLLAHTEGNQQEDRSACKDEKNKLDIQNDVFYSQINTISGFSRNARGCEVQVIQIVKNKTSL